MEKTKKPDEIDPPEHSTETAVPAAGPSYATADDAHDSEQAPVDQIEEASMESFPASDPPSSNMSHV